MNPQATLDAAYEKHPWSLPQIKLIPWSSTQRLIHDSDSITQNPAPGFHDALHLNYSTTNINKTHSMHLGVVLQFRESLPPQNFYSKEATVLLGYTELPDCGHASLPYCAMSDHYVHGVF